MFLEQWTKLNEDYGGARAKSTYACSSRHNCPGAFGTFNVQTIHGQLCLSFSYYAHVWNEATAKSYVQHFKRILREMSLT